MTDSEFLKKAIETSAESLAYGGFPVGAVVVVDDKVIATGISNGKVALDATSHAEIDAIRKASKKLGVRDLPGAVVYSSMEPCLMCFSACYWAGVTKIVYAIPKTALPKQHYEGLHDLRQVNNNNARSIQILHIPKLQESALKIVDEWDAQIPVDVL